MELARKWRFCKDIGALKWQFPVFGDRWLNQHSRSCMGHRSFVLFCDARFMQIHLRSARLLELDLKATRTTTYLIATQRLHHGVFIKVSYRLLFDIANPGLSPLVHFHVQHACLTRPGGVFQFVVSSLALGHAASNKWFLTQIPGLILVEPMPLKRFCGF